MKSALLLCSVPLPMATSVSNPFWYLSLNVITFQNSLLKDIPASAKLCVADAYASIPQTRFSSPPTPRPMPWTPLSLSLSWLHPCSVFLSYSYQHISFLFIFWYEKWSEVREALWQRNNEMKELRELPVISQEHVGRKHRSHLWQCVIGQHHPFIALFSFPILHGGGEFIIFTF